MAVHIPSSASNFAINDEVLEFRSTTTSSASAAHGTCFTESPLSRSKVQPHIHNFEGKGGIQEQKTENYLGGVGAGPGFKIDFQ